MTKVRSTFAVWLKYEVGTIGTNNYIYNRMLQEIRTKKGQNKKIGVA